MASGGLDVVLEAQRPLREVEEETFVTPTTEAVPETSASRLRFCGLVKICRRVMGMRKMRIPGRLSLPGEADRAPALQWQTSSRVG